MLSLNEVLAEEIEPAAEATSQKTLCDVALDQERVGKLRRVWQRYPACNDS